MLWDDDVIFEKVTSFTLIDACYGYEFPYEAFAQVFPNVQKLCLHLLYISSGRSEQEYIAAFFENQNYVLTLSPNLQSLDLGYDDDGDPLPDRESITKILAAVKQ